MKNLIKSLFVVIGLKSRTIKNRIGFKEKPISVLLSSISDINVGVFNPGIFDLFNNRRKDVILKEKSNQCCVLGRDFLIDDILKCCNIDKDDYLYIYTFYYLDFDIEKLNSINFNLILNSNISKEPFVISQQLFNLICKLHTLQEKINNNDLLIINYIKQQYTKLCNNVEYHVDGNHVIENLLSICLYEIYFFNDLKTTTILNNELNRQIDNFGHKERNAKYTLDIYLKLLTLDNLIKLKNNNYTFQKHLMTLENSLLKFYNSSFYSHDNINGDYLHKDINRLLNRSFLWNTSDILSVRPTSGMSGHSFDVSYYIPLPSNIKTFGTYNYANTKKRMFQRYRINNSQFCFKNNDVSAFFWKSFRLLFRLPIFKLRLNNNVFLFEFIISDFNLKLLKYKFKTIDNGWIVTSKNKMIYKVYLDEFPEISFTEIICGDFKFHVTKDDIIKVKKTVRSNYLGSLTKCYSLMIESNKFSLTKS